MTNMDFEIFQKEHFLKAALRPVPFYLVPPDPPANPAQIAEVEKQIGTRLSEKYRQFLHHFGGGSFGLTNVFSAYPEGDFYLPEKMKDLRGQLPAGLMPFSEDGAGGFYVLSVIANNVEDRVFYWNQDGGLLSTDFLDVLEFISRYAYSAA